MRNKIIRDLKILEKSGLKLRMPQSEHLQDGIFQLRSQVGNDISRILYFFFVGKDIILTNGFTKKTPKTPLKEIDLAKKYKKDYIDRRNKGEIENA